MSAPNGYGCDRCAGSAYLADTPADVRSCPDCGASSPTRCAATRGADGITWRCDLAAGHESPGQDHESWGRGPNVLAGISWGAYPDRMTRPMCAGCWRGLHGYAPAMGDGWSSFAPGECSACHRSLIVFTMHADLVAAS